jgi:uronate dehydrogenase
MNQPLLTSLRFNRLLLTGAAGNLGQQLRPRLKAYCNRLRLSDRMDMGAADQHEEIHQIDLSQADKVNELLKDVEAVVHMGGVSTEQPWAPILSANIIGVVNLYESARINGTKRIIFASSNHATGFYRQDQVIGTDAPPKPDGFYGLSKAFGEDVAEMYWNRWGIETVSLRIGSSFPEPTDRRMLSTWLSYDDLERLVVSALTAPIVKHSVIYGMSANRSSFWDNTGARHIGYQAQDSSEPYRPAIEARQGPVDISDPAVIYQGGGFVKLAPHG